jgi:hypothetical protein
MEMNRIKMNSKKEILCFVFLKTNSHAASQPNNRIAKSQVLTGRA